MNDLLSSKNAVFKTYVFYAVVLIIKMFLMSLLTGFTRYKKKTFISPEDVGLATQGKVKYDDPDVERIRRAHLNDVENIPIFLITGILFVLSNPNEFLAMTLIRLYTAFRILHTIVYTMIIIRQPARALMFSCGLIINLTMCVLIVIKFFHV
ncbi:hypothetical protein PGB90_006783 [Kerria lacca]